MVSKVKFIVVLARLGVNAEGNQWKTLSILLGHDDESKLLKSIGKIVGSVSQVGHDSAVTTLAKSDELVVLSNDLGSALGEVEGE